MGLVVQWARDAAEAAGEGEGRPPLGDRERVQVRAKLLEVMCEAGHSSAALKAWHDLLEDWDDARDAIQAPPASTDTASCLAGLLLGSGMLSEAHHVMREVEARGLRFDSEPVAHGLEVLLSRNIANLSAGARRRGGGRTRRGVGRWTEQGWETDGSGEDHRHHNQDNLHRQDSQS